MGKGHKQAMFRRGSQGSQLVFKRCPNFSVFRGLQTKSTSESLIPTDWKLRKLAHVGCGHLEPPCTAKGRTIVLFHLVIYPQQVPS